MIVIITRWVLGEDVPWHSNSSMSGRVEKKLVILLSCCSFVVAASHFDCSSIRSCCRVVTFGQLILEGIKIEEVRKGEEKRDREEVTYLCSQRNGLSSLRVNLRFKIGRLHCQLINLCPRFLLLSMQGSIEDRLGGRKGGVERDGWITCSCLFVGSIGEPRPRAVG